MKTKKILAIIVCISVFFPSLAKAVPANEMVNLCQSSGIAGYYSTVSKAAFDMVNVVFQDYLDKASKTNKKPEPAKQEAKNTQNDKAILPDSQSFKNFKTNMSGAVISFDTVKDVYVAKITGDGQFSSLSWLILLVIMLLLCVRKKDDYVAFSDIIVNTHPVCRT